ncbi:MAG TPA: ABC transporter permease, partial [Mycobacterium sp.]|uniref:ABC transporter permease n=1 Tax=Mycobacterium sp. TaxID=1785 RepID=UPI002D745FE1
KFPVLLVRFPFVVAARLWAARRGKQLRAGLEPSRRGLFGRARSVVPTSEILRSALDSLTSNRLRSVLTMIGIIIGVAAVILLVSLGNGMRADFNKQFSRLANQITITPATKAGSSSFTQGRNLTDSDVAVLRDPRRAPDIDSVSPSMGGDVTLTEGQIQDPRQHGRRQLQLPRPTRPQDHRR